MALVIYVLSYKLRTASTSSTVILRIAWGVDVSGVIIGNAVNDANKALIEQTEKRQ